jgi:hypothetical protein
LSETFHKYATSYVSYYDKIPTALIHVVFEIEKKYKTFQEYGRTILTATVIIWWVMKILIINNIRQISFNKILFDIESLRRNSFSCLWKISGRKCETIDLSNFKRSWRNYLIGCSFFFFWIWWKSIGIHWSLFFDTKKLW